jgi:aminoglycoside 6'-N-acetyltransferase I
MALDIKVLGPGDAGVLERVAPDTFDQTIDRKAAREFLADSRHHLVVAMDDGAVIGFASGVHYIHPDKPVPELWINEVGVASAHQGKGVGKAVLNALLQVGRELGCVQAWVLTAPANARALRLYESAGGVELDDGPVMFNFRLAAK